jgi:DNA-binding transcriptional LysR family regulator
VGARLHLTDEGKKLAQGFAPIRRELEKLLSEFPKGGGDEVEGLARLGLYLGFRAGLLVPSLEKTLKEHPGLQLKLRFASHRTLAHELLRDRIDLALTLQPLKQVHGSLLSRKIFEQDMVLVGPPRFAWPKNAEDFAELSVIEYYESSALFPDWMKHHWGTTPARPRIRAYAASLDHGLEFVRSGLGVAVVPADALKEGPAAELSVHKGRAKESLKGAVWLNLARSNYLRPPAEVLEKALVKRSWRLPP